MTGGHDAQPCRILEAIEKNVRVRRKLSDWDLDCGNNIKLKENLGDFSHFSWNRTSVQNGTKSTNAVLEKTQRYKVICASSGIKTKTNGPQRQSTDESSSSEDDEYDDETNNDVETPMCLEKSVEKQMCLDKAQNNFPFSCALSDIKCRSAFKDFEWSSDEENPLKYILPTKFKTIGKTARKSITTANSKREVIFPVSQETLPINHRRPSVKTKLKISRGEMLTKSMLQSYEGSSNRSSSHKQTVGKLLITKQNNRYAAFPAVQSPKQKS